MSQPDQIVIHCPACGGRLRAPREAIGTQVGCPTCQAAVIVKDPVSSSPIPMITDPGRRLGVVPRGDGGTMAAGFKDRLRTTAEPNFKVDPDNPVMKRRNNRRNKHADSLTEWDRPPHRHHHHQQRQTRRVMLVLGSLSVGLLLVLGGLFWQRVQQRPGDLPSNPAAARPLELQAVSDFRDEVWMTVHKFCTSPNPDAFLPLLREPDRVAPLIKRFYNSENPWIPLPLARRPDLSDLKVHRNFVAFQLPLTNFGTQAIALEQTPDGFRIDWESFVGYSDLSWADLRRTRPRQPVLLRAVVKPSDYFNMDFPSAGTHRCYQVSDIHSDHVLYGYVPVGSDVEVQIQKILLTAPEVHAVLRVRYPEKSTSDRQLEITEVLEKGWIFREDDNPEVPREIPPTDLAQPPVQTTPGTSSTKPGILPGVTGP